MTKWLQTDDQVQNLSINEVGWVGVDKNAAEIQSLKQKLEQHNGITGLQVFEPDELEAIVDVFYRDGFVVAQNVLSADQLSVLKAACDEEVIKLLSKDKERSGNRGSHRYSFGSASRTGHMMHRPEWAMLLDLDTLTPIMSAIFGSSHYIARGGGGDFCLPGATKYQPLHSDMSNAVHHLHQGKTYTFGSFMDPRGILNYRDLPAPYVCCNFLVVDSNATNGPIRQIPGTQHSHHPMPKLDAEPDWMKHSTVNPAPAGSVIIRDVRAWHGGTPNLSDEVRAIPNVEFYAPWFRENLLTSVPRDIFESLSEHGQNVAKYIAAAEGQSLDIGYRNSLGGTPDGF
jgi:ectoine hydroxylase-related dioxygenase (phytanoyl-CoA dioxygenase family)